MNKAFFKIKAPVAALIFFAALALFGGCSGVEQQKEGPPENNVSVVVTLSFFEDMVQQVAGEKIELTSLVPVGVEPEEYDPQTKDIRAIKNADVFIYNGLNMERWLPRIISDYKERENYYALAEHPSIKTKPLPSGPFEGEPDPHAWTNVNYAIVYVEQISSILSQIDPTNEDFYQEQAESYIKELQELNQWMEDKVKEVPEENRLLITSELCFQYFAEAYGFDHEAIWPINAPEEGTPSQIIRLVEVVKEKDPPALFVENQVDHRPMERVSRETGVPIKGVLYSDSLSAPGEGGETYIDMMKSNARQIVEALKE